ncbi:MAG TPA: hypothetical protein VFX78_00695 [Candidatus Eisenbacteria bacterium]|nr:hypothetical protein [Candidatus Eisenbacteria bacterium]
MNSHHPDLAAGRWHSMSLMEQLANAGSEVSRALRARGNGNAGRERSALYRFLDLIDMTIADPRLKGRRKEVCRTREIVCDYFVGENVHRSTPESLDRYFLPFAEAARRKSGGEALGRTKPGT